MGGSILSKYSLEFGTVFFSKHLQKLDVEHFVFFGTLLGMSRCGAPIEGDDDVDFYVNRKDYGIVQSMLIDLGFEIDYTTYPNNSDCFIQVDGNLNDIDLRVDFYFYDSDSDENFILENWNFLAQPNNTSLTLKLPKPLVYPIIMVPYSDGKIALPQHSEIICEFLYGVNWKTPQKKGTDYTMHMIGGRPVRVFKQSGSATLLA